MTLEFGASDLVPFGSYVDLEVTGHTRSSVLDAMVAFGRGAYRRKEFVSLLQEGSLLVCFDNLTGKDPRQFSAVKEFCAEFPKCRYFFAMREEVEFSLVPEKIPRPIVDVDVLFLHPFGRKQTRILIQNWFLEDPERSAEKVDEVLALLKRLNVPRSPFLISALLWIRERRTQFSPINQAEILDALIDGVMEKLSEQKDRSGLDANIKRHYLAALAEHLHVSGSKRITSLDLEKFTIEYFTSKGLPSPTAPFLADLKAKGILLELGDEVTFMFDAVRAFFLSTRLHEDSALLERALSVDHFLELGEELDYYTGRFRDQPHVLEKAISLVSAFRSATELDPDLSTFDKIQLSPNPFAEALSDEGLPERPTTEARNELLESVDDQLRSKPPNDVGRLADERRRTANGRFLEALGIGSAILRNSELVSDVGLKRRAYAELIAAWGMVLINVVQSIERGVDELELEAMRAVLPENPGLARYLLQMITPNVIVAFAFESIGTTKLHLVMEEHARATSMTVERVIDAFLMADLRAFGWVEALRALVKDFERQKFVCDLVFAKLIQIYMFGRLTAREEPQIRSLLGDSLALILSETRSDKKTRMKGKFLSRLDKHRIAGGK